MSNTDQFWQSAKEAPLLASSAKSVVCWRCDAPMKIKTIEPAMAEPYDEIVYQCPACHLERNQIAARSRQ
jgi:hypothetical protein